MSKLTRSDITAEVLRSFLRYDPLTGHFTWLDTANQAVRGKIAGSKTRFGYIRITLGVSLGFAAHRLAWLYVHGKWPTSQIDHINRDKTDNRIVNLREATAVQNCANRTITKRNTTGFKGVYRRSDGKAWCGCIRVGGRLKHLGSFSDIRDASAAYFETAKTLYGDFAASE